MSYRNITVDGIGYEYVIGRAHLKIKGAGLYLKSLVGDRLGMRTFVVTPKTVERVLRGRIKPEPKLCAVHGTVCDGLVVNPFQSEVHGRIVHMLNCRRCLTASRNVI